MKVYLHIEGDYDLTVVRDIEDPSATPLNSLVREFVETFNSTHKEVKLPSKQSALHVTAKQAASSKKLDMDAKIGTVAKDGQDLWIHGPKPEVVKKPATAPKPVKMAPAKPVPTQLNSEDDIKKQLDLNAKQRAESDIAKAMNERSYREARELSKSLLKLDRKNTVALTALGDICMSLSHWENAAEWYEQACRADPSNVDHLMNLGKALFGAEELEDALKAFQRGLTATEDKPSLRDSRDFEVEIARVLQRSGQWETAHAVVAKILQKDMEHRPALFAFAELLAERNMGIDDQVKVLLRLFVTDQNNKETNRLIANVLSKEQGFQVLQELLPPAANTASCYDVFGNACRNQSQIRAALKLYRTAIKAGGRAGSSYVLQEIHCLELDGVYQPAVDVVRAFLAKNQALSVGGVSATQILDLLDEVEDIDDTPPSRYECDVDFPKPASDETKEVEYSRPELDLYAVFCTLVKILYLRARFTDCARIVKLILPIGFNRDLHLTTIRNENAYLGCVRDLLPHAPKAPVAENTPTIYLVGDSHCLPLAYQHLKYKGQVHTIKSSLVTGCKVWHLRDESKFYTKYSFDKAVGAIPDGATVIFLLGEIDCREGLLNAVEKCHYDTLRDALVKTVKLYLKVVRGVTSRRKFNTFVHPVPPVLDVTRGQVTQFNDILCTFVGVKKSVRYLNFSQELLQGSSLRPEYSLDGTHLNPAYIPLIESALERAEAGTL